MTPRSADFLREAATRLDDAKYALAGGRHALAVGAAYYACLYAARAALSEVDENPRSHGGTWSRFRAVYVVDGRVPEGVYRAAAALQRRREEADYEAVVVTDAAARAAVEAATALLDAVRSAT